MSVRLSIKILIALVVTLVQVWFYSIGKIGDGLFPFWIPLMVTTLCALISRSYLLAFAVGFLSFTAFPIGIFWFYYVRGSIQLPDLKGLLAVMAWSSLFGLIGLLAVKISRSEKTQFRCLNNLVGVLVAVQVIQIGHLIPLLVDPRPEFLFGFVINLSAGAMAVPVAYAIWIRRKHGPLIAALFAMYAFASAAYFEYLAVAHFGEPLTMSLVMMVVNVTIMILLLFFIGCRAPADSECRLSNSVSTSRFRTADSNSHKPNRAENRSSYYSIFAPYRGGG